MATFVFLNESECIQLDPYDYIKFDYDVATSRYSMLCYEKSKQEVFTFRSAFHYNQAIKQLNRNH